MSSERTPDSTTILHINTPELVDQWRARFAESYPAVFTGAPYFEDISNADAVAVWDRLTAVPENITLLAINSSNDVLGFGIAIPLNKQKDVSTELTGLIPVPHTFYLAELGVLPSARGRGLGRALVKQRMDLIDRERYAGVVLRVAEGRNTSKLMYEAMGFEDMGVYMEVEAPRVDGTRSNDRRLFLYCVLSQVEMDTQSEDAGSK